MGEYKEVFLYSRFITKKEAINRFGKLGFKLHKEGVYVLASSIEEAREKIKPFNHKKHIKFKFEAICIGLNEKPDLQTETIIDFGSVEEEE